MPKAVGFFFYPGDYLRDTQCLGEKAQVAYDRIMCEHCRNVEHMKNICISQDRLKFFTKRFTSEDMAELSSVLQSTPDGFQIAWVADSILKAKSYGESRSKNRAGKKKIISTSHEQHMDIDIDLDKEDEEGKKGGVGEGEPDPPTPPPPPRQDPVNVPFAYRMLDVWLEVIPTYTRQDEYDLPALRVISEFIFHDAGIANGLYNLDDQQKCLDTFRLVAAEVNKEPFWRIKPLKTIANNLQEFYNKIKTPANGTNQQQPGEGGKRVNGKRSTIDGLKDLRQQMAERYSGSEGYGSGAA